MKLEELKHLKEVCAKATPGEWRYKRRRGEPFADVLCETGPNPVCSMEVLPRGKEDGKFIATFNPTQVAELLELAEIGLRHEKWIHGKLGGTPNEP